MISSKFHIEEIVNCVNDIYMPFTTPPYPICPASITSSQQEPAPAPDTLTPHKHSLSPTHLNIIKTLLPNKCQEIAFKVIQGQKLMLCYNNENVSQMELHCLCICVAALCYSNRGCLQHAHLGSRRD